MMRLKHWYLYWDTALGEVYGNDKFTDGKAIRTSPIKNVLVDKENREVTIITKNSEYHASIDDCRFSRMGVIPSRLDMQFNAIMSFKDEVVKKILSEYARDNILTLVFDDTADIIHYAVARYNGEEYYLDDAHRHLGMLDDAIVLKFPYVAKKPFVVDIGFKVGEDNIEFFKLKSPINVEIKNCSTKNLRIKGLGQEEILVESGTSKELYKSLFDTLDGNKDFT